jgi:hypothetical protein
MLFSHEPEYHGNGSSIRRGESHFRGEAVLTDGSVDFSPVRE